MILGSNKQNAIDSLVYCYEKGLFDTEYIRAKAVLLPLAYSDVTEADVQSLLTLMNPVVEVVTEVVE